MAATDSVNVTHSWRRKIFPWLVRLGLCAAALFICLLAVLYVFLQRDPEALVNAWLGPLEQKTGLKFEIGSVDVTLLPLPAMSLSDLRINGSGVKFSAAWVSARPGFARIFAGDLFPGVITILRPRLGIELGQPLCKVPELLAAFSPVSSGGGSFLPADLDIDISQFSAEVRGTDNERVTLAGFQCQLSVDRCGEISGELSFSGLRLFEGSKPVASLENFRAEGESSYLEFFGMTRHLRVNGEARYSGAIRSSQFNIEMETLGSTWKAGGAISAAMDAGGSSVPLALTGEILRTYDGRQLEIRHIDWQLGPDSGNFSAMLALPFNPARPAARGTLFANRLSLTQWFGFARNLCPGLQITLDNITRASARFETTETGISVTDIEATCAGSVFRGSGGVPDWKKPSVDLDLKTDVANLGTGLPESLAQAPDSPWYPHPPLTPLPTEPLKPGETGIDYDIRLAADTTIYGPVKFQQSAVRIYPGKMDVTGFQDVLIDAKGKFYGGSVTGSCILGADPSLPYYITTKANDINGAQLAKAMPVLPFRKGEFDAGATVTSRGKELKRFLAALKGEISVEGTRITLAAGGVNEIVPRLAASANLRSASIREKRLVFDGTWRASITRSDLSARCEASGFLGFGAGGFAFKNLDGNVEASFSDSFLPKESKLALKGIFSGEPEEGRFDVDRATLQVLGQTFHGKARVEADRIPPAFRGELKTEIGNLNSALSRFGFKGARMPSEFNSLKLAADFAGDPGSIRLDKIRASLGRTDITGSVRWQNRKPRQRYEVDLRVEKLDTGSFTGGKRQQPGPDQWNFRALNTFDMSGKLRLGELLIWDLRLANVQLPFRLEAGRLNSGNISAHFYGAPLKGSINASFQTGLSFDSSVEVHGFNLLEAARARKIEAIITGSASVEAKIGARVNGNASLAKALNGKWSFDVLKGSWQGVDKNRAPKGKPTTFNAVSASGTIQNGVVASRNFSLSGSGLKVAGGGSLNLANQEVNCNFNVDMKGLPDFPLRLYGTLANTKTSIGAGKLVLNAMGEVINGFAGAVGGVLKGAWNIFSK